MDVVGRSSKVEDAWVKARVLAVDALSDRVRPTQEDSMATDQPLPAKVPLTLYRGDTRIWEDTFRSVPVAPATVGDPINLTGFAFLAQIRAGVDALDVMAAIAVDVIDAAGGVIRRTLTADEAKNLTGESAYWDLQVTDPTGFVRTYMAGKVKILGDVSRV